MPMHSRETSPLDAASAVTQACPHCGEKNVAHARFCRACGLELTQGAQDVHAREEQQRSVSGVSAFALTEQTDRLPVGEIICSEDGVDLYIVTHDADPDMPRTYLAHAIATDAQVMLHEAISPAGLPGLLRLLHSDMPHACLAALEPAFSSTLFGVERLYVPEVIATDEVRVASTEDEYIEVMRQLMYGLSVLHVQAGVAFDLTPEDVALHCITTEAASTAPAGRRSQLVARWCYLRDLVVIEDHSDAPHHDVRAVLISMQDKLKSVPELCALIENESLDLSAAKVLALLGDPLPALTAGVDADPHVVPFEWGSRTDKGRQRSDNEDSCLVMSDEVTEQSQTDAKPSMLLLVVADGMGGEEAGETASSVIIDTLESLFTAFSKGYKAMSSGSGATGAGNLPQWVEKVVDSANARVLAEAARLGNQMGSTLVLALIHEGMAYLGNVGDSRIYRWNPKRDRGRMLRLTRDHSLVQSLVDSGQITDEQRYTHPDRNLVLRSLGDTHNARSDRHPPVPMQPGDWLLLCSDGLWEMVRDNRIREILSSAASAQEACDRLIAEANKNGGEDNVTAVIARFR